MGRGWFKGSALGLTWLQTGLGTVRAARRTRRGAGASGGQCVIRYLHERERQLVRLVRAQLAVHYGALFNEPGRVVVVVVVWVCGGDGEVGVEWGMGCVPGAAAACSSAPSLPCQASSGPCPIYMAAA